MIECFVDVAFSYSFAKIQCKYQNQLIFYRKKGGGGGGGEGGRLLRDRHIHTD